MPLEDMTGTDKYPDVLNNAWPLNGDATSEGNNHIFGVKNVVINWAAGYETAALKGQVGTDIDTKITANNTDYVDPAIATAVSDNNTNYVDPTIDAAIRASQLVGEIKQWPLLTLPTGFLLCDGSSQLTATYPDLFAVLGYEYGGSGGNFNLPDFRGVFLRGFDESRGLDADGNRAVNNLQQDRVADHTHTITDPGHTHEATKRGVLQTSAGAGLATSDNTTVSGSSTTGITIDNTGNDGAPKNYPIRFIIRT